MNTDRYERFSMHHLRWASYYALAAIITLICAGVALGRAGVGPFIALIAIGWYFVRRCRKHRLLAGLQL